MFTLNTLKDYKFIKNKGDIGSKSMVSDLILVLEKMTCKLKNISGFLAQKDVEIARLKALLQQASSSFSKWPGSPADLKQENDHLKSKL